MVLTLLLNQTRKAERVLPSTATCSLYLKWARPTSSARNDQIHFFPFPLGTCYDAWLGFISITVSSLFALLRSSIVYFFYAPFRIVWTIFIPLCLIFYIPLSLRGSYDNQHFPNGNRFLLLLLSCVSFFTVSSPPLSPGLPCRYSK